MDDFRVLSNSGSTPPVGFRITPAISPIFGNNPAFSVLNYSVSTGAVFDIATYYLDLVKGGDNPQWALEYRFSTAYGYNAFTARNLETLAAAIHGNPNVSRFSPVAMLLRLLHRLPHATGRFMSAQRPSSPPLITATASRRFKTASLLPQGCEVISDRRLLSLTVNEVMLQYYSAFAQVYEAGSFGRTAVADA
jgi:hypothetical protein